MSQAKVNAIFPTVIYEHDLDQASDLEPLLREHIKPHMFDRDRGIQGEYLGLAKIHLDPDLEPFYSMIAEEARIYLEVLGINNDFFDLYIVKSTLSLLSNSEDHFSVHKHNSSDLSFVYYLSVPEGADCIFFHNQHKPNELFDGIFAPHRPRKMITEWNPFNAESFYIEPKPGKLVVFPGKLFHSTGPNPNHPNGMQAGERIAIVGDINLMLKPEQDNWESGKVSLDVWKKF